MREWLEPPDVGRSPHGERGLKYRFFALNLNGFESLSSWRAWIEITSTGAASPLTRVALLMESVD